MAGVVGIIANPASGKDIRRLVAHASTFDNNEKTNIVRRVLLALDALGVSQVHHMPESHGICERAAHHAGVSLALTPLPMEVIGHPSDSTEAAQRLVDMGAGCIVTLGGDGTNRVVAKGSGTLPLVPISTGTNNVFPTMVEGTLAGLAAGIAALRPDVAVLTQRPRMMVSIDGDPRDMALVDVATSPQSWVGARAVWDSTHLREIVVSRVPPAAIGLSGVAALLHPEVAGTNRGVHIVLGEGGSPALCPIAPGIMRTLAVRSTAVIAPGDVVQLQSGAGTIALDGEREIELLRHDQARSLTVELLTDGPWVVDIPATISAAATAGLFSDPELTPNLARPPRG